MFRINWDTENPKIKKIMDMLKEGIRIVDSETGIERKPGEHPSSALTDFICYQDVSKKAKIVWISIVILMYKLKLMNPFRYDHEFCEDVRSLFPDLNYSDKTIRHGLRELVRNFYLVKPRLMLYEMHPDLFKHLNTGI